MKSTWMIAAVGVLTLSGCSKDKKDEPQAAQKQVTTSAAPEQKAAAPSVDIPAAPKSLGALRVPQDNPTTPAKVALGRKLFFDKALSVDGSRACYSCHLNEDGTGGHEPLAIGAGNVQLTRHAPIMWNVGYLPAFYWDGRATTLEAQAKGAWAGGNMGVGEEGLMKKADEIGSKPDYEPLFDAAFPGEGATPDTIVKALAAYERTLFCGDTAWDRFEAGDTKALSDQQKTGWQLFKGKGNCASCHTPPFFSDAFMAAGGAYHNTGKGIEGKKPEEIDVGRKKVSGSDSDFAAFKTPSLRNVSKSAPYFHNGSVAELEEAVRFMASGGYKNKNLDPKLVDRKLSDDEVKAIVAFLEALDCEGELEPPKD